MLDPWIVDVYGGGTREKDVIKISCGKGQEQEQGVLINASYVRTRGDEESLVRRRRWTLGCYFVFLLQ